MQTIYQLLFALCLITISSCNTNDAQPWERKTIELDEKSVQLVESGNEFGLELFKLIYDGETESENIMVSPLSVSLALAMTYNGAQGETKAAMEQALKMRGLSADEINSAYRSLIKALQSLDPKVVLEIANAIFYKEDYLVESNFISTNKTHYDAEISPLNFSSPEALKTINGWVDDKTNGKIEKIIDQISGDHVMFLLNAIYFNGIWKNEFKETETRKRPFYRSKNGSPVEVTTMQKTDAVPYINNDVFSAIKMAYGAGNYNMYVFLPHTDNSLEDILNGLSQNNWTDWMESFSDSVNADIKLPRLKYDYEIKLNQVLSDMGMQVAFTDNANFTGINKAGNLKIDEVKHKTFIEVNEKGTEAAAVTSVGMVVTSIGPPTNVQFNVNRPFFYAICEEDTNAILFMGTVKNPDK